MDYGRFMVKQPLRLGPADPSIKNRTYPPLTYMSSSLVQEANYYVEFSWVWGMPEPVTYLGEQVSDYDQVLCNIGGDCHNPEDLGAEIEYVLGNKVFTTNTTGAIFIPRGVKHGPLTYKAYSHPHARLLIVLGTGDRDQVYRNTEAAVDESINYEKYLVRRPAYEVIAGTPIVNRQSPSSMTFMSNNLVPGCNIYVEGGWVWGMPEPNPHIFEHVHPKYEELVLHFGTNYENPEELGGEIEFPVGDQPLTLDKTSMVYVPKDVKHGPLTWKKYSAPHLEVAIIPGAGSLQEADPGGHIEKKQSGK